MEGQPFGENGIVTTFERFDEPGSQRNVPFSCSIRDVTGAAQQPLHLARPLFSLDFDQSLQFAQMMSIAQGVQHAFYRVIGLPMIVRSHDILPRNICLKLSFNIRIIRVPVNASSF
jgi:hypothetical protein